MPPRVYIFIKIIFFSFARLYFIQLIRSWVQLMYAKCVCSCCKREANISNSFCFLVCNRFDSFMLFCIDLSARRKESDWNGMASVFIHYVIVDLCKWIQLFGGCKSWLLACCFGHDIRSRIGTLDALWKFPINLK